MTGARWLGAFAALTGVALGAACTVPDLDLADKKSDPLAPTTTNDYCVAIPRFTGTQVVDGNDSDLGSLPAIAYPWSVLKPSSGLTLIGDKLDTTARIGWSDLGVHLYFKVTYETGMVIVPTGTDQLWYGDALEIFLKGDAVLTGAYGGGADPGALQIIVVPDATNPPRTEMAVGYGEDLGPLVGAQTAVASGTTAYAIEYLIPWSRISGADAGAAGPGAGQSIGFMFGVDYRDRDAGATSQPDYQLTLPLNAVSGGTPCPYTTPIPSCDDRTWCQPKLLP